MCYNWPPSMSPRFKKTKVSFCSIRTKNKYSIELHEAQEKTEVSCDCWKGNGTHVFGLFKVNKKNSPRLSLGTAGNTYALVGYSRLTV